MAKNVRNATSCLADSSVAVTGAQHSSSLQDLAMSDAVPLFHSSVGLAPMLEVALLQVGGDGDGDLFVVASARWTALTHSNPTQVSAFADEGLVNAGYCQANEALRDTRCALPVANSPTFVLVAASFPGPQQTKATHPSQALTFEASCSPTRSKQVDDIPSRSAPTSWLLHVSAFNQSLLGASGPLCTCARTSLPAPRRLSEVVQVFGVSLGQHRRLAPPPIARLLDHPLHGGQ